MRLAGLLFCFGLLFVAFESVNPASGGEKHDHHSHDHNHDRGHAHSDQHGHSQSRGRQSDHHGHTLKPRTDQAIPIYTHIAIYCVLIVAASLTGGGGCQMLSN